MNNRDLEGKIKNAVEKTAPDVWERVQRDIGYGKGKIVNMLDKKRKSKIIGFVSSIAAALVLISAAVFGISNYSRADEKIVSTVAIEVNPEIKLSLNTYNVVLKAEADNEDGKKVLGTMDLKGSQLEVAINAIVGSMLKNGYLNDNSNSLLVSVENEDDVKARELHLEVQNNINGAMKGESFGGSAVVQTVEVNDKLKQTAEKYGISLGKAEFIKFLQKNGSDKNIEELASLSVNDLNLIFEGLNNHDEYEYKNDDYKGGVSYSGKADDGKYIGVDKVKEIAFKSANVNEKDVRDFEADLDYENGIMVYEVEFESGTKEYDYEVNALSGEILDIGSSKTNGNQVASKTSSSTNKASSNTANTSSKNNEFISRDKALSIALSHAGVTSDKARDKDAYLDEDDGVYHYDIEFKADGYEYEYEINAVSGKVIKSDKERDD